MAMKQKPVLAVGEPEDDDVEKALHEAAISGNVWAMQLWLQRHGKRPEPPVGKKSLIAQLVEMAEENLNVRP